MGDVGCLAPLTLIRSPTLPVTIASASAIVGVAAPHGATIVWRAQQWDGRIDPGDPVAEFAALRSVDPLDLLVVVVNARVAVPPRVVARLVVAVSGRTLIGLVHAVFFLASARYPTDAIRLPADLVGDCRHLLPGGDLSTAPSPLTGFHGGLGSRGVDRPGMACRPRQR
ncbi:hypothetical protein [Austwickia sp. TVS 96-490-7B]|uniref:hypothetical protein n=1 Tax=Austwickia sp. TVS 96-490-7B TaxID=2830843 RepID=UPI002106CB7C|nr:hypothetical protein [Austwickia sp. TVS 96-490-7B]